MKSALVFYEISGLIVTGTDIKLDLSVIALYQGQA